MNVVRAWLMFGAMVVLSCALERDAVTSTDATMVDGVSVADGSADSAPVMDVVPRDVRVDVPRDRAQDEPSEAATVDVILMANADAVDVMDVASTADADDASSPDVVVPDTTTVDVVSPDIQDAADMTMPPDIATTDTRPDVPMTDSGSDAPQDVRPDVAMDTGSGMDVIASPDVATDTGPDVRPDVPDVVTDTGPAPYVCSVTRLCVEYDATGMTVPVSALFRLIPTSVGVPGPWTSPCNNMLDRQTGTDLYRCAHDADPFPAPKIVQVSYVSAGNVGFCTSTGCPGIPDRLRYWSHGVPVSGASNFMPVRAALDPARPNVLSWVIQFIVN